MSVEDYVSFQIKTLKKNNTKVLCASGLTAEIPNDEKLFDEVAKKYIEALNSHEKIAVMIDFRKTEKVNPKMVWKKIGEHVAEIKKAADKSMICSTPLVKGKLVKGIVNSVINVYPDSIPVKVCESNAEAIEFINSQIKN